MPLKKKEQEREYLELIRKVLVYFPSAGVLTIQKFLERQKTVDRPQGLHLDYIYLGKLVGKIRIERAKRISIGTLRRISQLQDHYEVMAGEVRTIASSQNLELKDKGNLLIKVFEKNLILFEAEMNAGIYERKGSVGEINLTQIFQQINKYASSESNSPVDNKTNK